MKGTRKNIFVSLAFVCLATLVGHEAWALSCRGEPIPLEKQVREADAIFVAKYISGIDELKAEVNGANKAAKVQVIRLLKGQLKDDVIVHYKRPIISTCSQDIFREFSSQVGRASDMLLFAKKYGEALYISYELGSTLAEIAEEKTRKVLGLESLSKNDVAPKKKAVKRKRRSSKQ